MCCSTGLQPPSYLNIKECQSASLLVKTIPLPERVAATADEFHAVRMNFTGHINPDVSIESFTMNITTVKGFDEFKASVTDPSTGASRVDLILSCVDNYEARITINQVWHAQPCELYCGMYLD